MLLRLLQVEELALQSMIQASEESVPVPLAALAEDTQQVRGSLGSEGAPGLGLSASAELGSACFSCAAPQL